MTRLEDHEQMRVNPDTGEYEFLGVTEDGRIIAKKGDEQSEIEVAKAFLDTRTGQIFDRDFNTEENRVKIAAQIEKLRNQNRLLENGAYTVRELEMIVKDMLEVGDLEKPVPTVVKEEPGPEAEYEAWSRNATASMRQQRRSEDAGYRAWHESEGRIQRIGADITAADMPAVIEPNLVDFVKMWRSTPRDVLRPKMGYYETPGFLTGRLSVEEFNQFLDLATKARLL